MQQLFPVLVNEQGGHVRHGFTEKIRVAYSNGLLSGHLAPFFRYLDMVGQQYHAAVEFHEV
jgi:hypothetical protein